MDEVALLEQIAPKALIGVLIGLVVTGAIVFLKLISEGSVQPRNWIFQLALPFGGIAGVALYILLLSLSDRMTTHGIVVIAFLLMVAACVALFRPYIGRRSVREVASWWAFAGFMLAGVLIFSVGTGSHESTDTMEWGSLAIGIAGGIAIFTPGHDMRKPKPAGANIQSPQNPV